MTGVDPLAIDRAGFWMALFTSGAYTATLACLYWGIREGARTAWWHGLVEIGWFSFLAIGFQALFL